MVPRYFTQALDRVEGHELMLVKIELLGLETRQPGFQQLVRCKPRPNRYIGDARPDHRLNAVDLFRTTGERSPEHHVACPRIVAEQQSPGSLHDGAERDLSRLSQQSQTMRDLPRE